MSYDALRKVLVVDNGRRTDVDLLSSELAELGMPSVTTSVEAAVDVLDMIGTPCAILLNMPTSQAGAERDTFERLAASLRAGSVAQGIPVIEWTPESALIAGGISAILKAEIGPRILAEPDL